MPVRGSEIVLQAFTFVVRLNTLAPTANIQPHRGPAGPEATAAMAERPKGRKRPTRQTKGKVLQARIPENLDDQLRDRATTLGLSVSTIVRNVLMNTFDLVEGVVKDSSELARTARRRPQAPAENPPGELGLAAPRSAAAVVAWQQAALNLNAVCEQCNAILSKGQLAAIGIPIPARPVFLCLDCLAGLGAPGTPTSSRE